MGNNVCQICGYKGGSGHSAVSVHIVKKHGLTCEEYFDKYLRTSPDEGICKTCGNKTVLISFIYREFCSQKCKGSFISKKNWQNPEYRKIMSGSSKKLWENPEFFMKMSNLMKERWKNPEFSSMMVENTKLMINEKWSDPNFVESVSKSKIEMWKDPEYRRMMSINSSKKAKEKWDRDVEYREMMTELAKRMNSDPSINFGYTRINRSKGEVELFNFVQSFADAVSCQKIFLNEEEKEKYNFTFVVPDVLTGNKIIEFNGDYWHNLPDRIESDMRRTEFLKSRGYIIFIVWEHEWYEDKHIKEKVRNFVLNEN